MNLSRDEKLLFNNLNRAPWDCKKRNTKELKKLPLPRNPTDKKIPKIIIFSSM